MMFPGMCILLLTLLSTTAALKCRECAYFRGATQHPALKSILEDMMVGNKKVCKDDPDQAGSLDCSEKTLTDGNDEWRCVHRDDRMMAEIDGKPVNVSLISRDCEQVANNGLLQDDSCYHSDNMRQKLATMLQSISPEARLKNVHGHYCICNSNHCNNNIDPHVDVDSGVGANVGGCAGLVLAVVSVLVGPGFFTR